MNHFKELHDRFRVEEYTGENRCPACTVLNLSVAAFGSILLGMYSISAGATLFAFSVILIYFRGYLIPKTPTITKQYFPPWLLALFDKEPAHTRIPIEHSTDSETFLREAGVLTECEETEDICLEESFRREWEATIEDIRETGLKTAIADSFDIDKTKIEVTHPNNSSSNIRVTHDEEMIGTWDAEPLLIVDLASYLVLQRRITNWDELPDGGKNRATAALRTFLARCPVCEDLIVEEEEEIETCCRSKIQMKGLCPSCNTEFFKANRFA